MLLAVFIFLYFKFIKVEDGFQGFSTLFLHWYDWLLSPYFLLALFFSPLNWFLESLKWQELVKYQNRISVKEAFRGVLAGLTFAFVTPHSIGDYAGRILHLHNKERATTIGPLFFGNICQMLMTVIFAVVGYFYLLQSGTGLPQLIVADFSFWVFSMISIVTGIFIIAFYLYIPHLLKRENASNGVKFVKPYLKAIYSIDTSSMLKVLAFSCLRYLVFLIQFYLVLRSLGIIYSMLPILSSIALVYFMKSVLPSFNFLSDLGLREAAAVVFLGAAGLGLQEPTVIIASLLVWIINILLPTLVGLFSVWQIKLDETI